MLELLQLVLLLIAMDKVQCEWSLRADLNQWQGTSYLFGGSTFCDHDSTGTCDPYFAFCFQPASSEDGSSDNCPWGSYVTNQAIQDDDNFYFSEYESQLGIDIPLVFNVSGAYPGSFRLFVTVMDDSGVDDSLIEKIDIVEETNVDGEHFTALTLYQGLGDGGNLKAQFQVTCLPHHFGADCSVYCKSVEGDHFSCDENGSKVCLANWTDPNSNCQTSLHPCQGQSLCFNGANCTDNETGGYDCLCLPGWTGKNCEVNVDDCQENPCQNEGMCIDAVDGYLCVCPSGFEGQKCETSIKKCTVMPCLNGGSCLEDNAFYHCVCPAGYMGPHCEFPIIETCDKQVNFTFISYITTVISPSGKVDNESNDTLTATDIVLISFASALFGIIVAIVAAGICLVCLHCRRQHRKAPACRYSQNAIDMSTYVEIVADGPNSTAKAEEMIYHNKEVELSCGVAASGGGFESYEEMASCQKSLQVARGLSSVSESTSVAENMYMVMAAAPTSGITPQQQNIYESVDTAKKNSS